MEIKLLAWDADKKGTLGFLLHRCGKKFLRFAIDKLANNIMKDVIEYKKAKGWHNQEVKILYDDLTEVIRACRHGEDEVKNNTGNYKVYCDVRDIFCTIMDEDSYYLLRFFYFLDLTFEHENRYRMAHHKARVYWRWEEIADVLRAEREQLEKLTDHPTDDQYEEIFQKARERIINGTIKGKANAGAEASHTTQE